jgi:hypothetical protein
MDIDAPGKRRRRFLGARLAHWISALVCGFSN